MAIQKFTTEQVAKHNTSKSCWVIYKNKVYDVTKFLEDHPGGEDYILEYAGKDVEQVMNDHGIHDHSDSAFGMLDDFFVGRLADADDDGSEYVTDPALGVKSEKFVDPNRPMLYQVWKSGFSKEFYLEQVHIPRHTKESPPIFGNNYLELLTKTPWWVVPLVWLPLGQSYTWEAAQELNFTEWFPLWLIGIVIWTLIEYTLHRFLFHMDKLLPDNRVGITLHFLLHGIHHFIPMDKYRLVLPPALFLILASPFWWFAHRICPLDKLAIGYAIGGGVLFGYTAYDCMHYYLHHGKVVTSHAREMKKYHVDHHYKAYQLGFGITSKVWDWCFGTLIPYN